MTLIAFICPRCNCEKPIDRASKRFRDGIRKSPDRCLDCEAEAQRLARILRSDEIRARNRSNYPRHKTKQRDTMLRKKYGIGMNEWSQMFALQGSVCAICSANTPGGRGWQTDHNHRTGAVRAILCHNCNALLGHAKESPQVLLSAFRYLYLHGGGAVEFFSHHFSQSTHPMEPAPCQ